MERLRNQVKSICHFIHKYFGVIVLACLLPYILGGAFYNFYCKNLIQNRVETLQSVAYEVTPLQSYEVRKFEIVPANTLISRKISATVFAKENPDVTYEKFMQYFTDKGWKNTENDVKNKRMTFKNEKYIFSLHLGDKERQNIPGTYKWKAYIQFNDFFSKYNL